MQGHKKCMHAAGHKITTYSHSEYAHKGGFLGVRGVSE